MRDVPRVEALRRAQSLMHLYGPGTAVWFSFLCPYCDARCKLEVPNELPSRGSCWQCGRESDIYEASLAIEITRPPDPEEGETD